MASQGLLLTSSFRHTVPVICQEMQESSMGDDNNVLVATNTISQHFSGLEATRRELLKRRLILALRTLISPRLLYVRVVGDSLKLSLDLGYRRTSIAGVGGDLLKHWKCDDGLELISSEGVETGIHGTAHR